MFLRPQHFQSAERHWHDTLQRNSRWDRPYHWGLQEFEIDEEAIKTGLFKIRRLAARLRDGTVIRVPDDGVLADLDLKPFLVGSDPVEVALAVPVLQKGRPNLGDGQNAVSRYRLDTFREGVADENDGRVAAPFAFRRLNLRLVAGGEARAGYETLPIAQVERSSQIGATPQLARSYIPPLLWCDAWVPLARDILQEVSERIDTFLESQAKVVRDGRIRLGSTEAEALRQFERFRILNEAATYLGVFAYAQGVHPLDAYLELCRLVGRLAVFGPNLPVYVPPKYDHDDLGTCFTRVKQFIDELLVRGINVGFEQERLIGFGLALKGGIKPAWLAGSWQMYVGVQSTLPSADCAKYLTGRLNMKIGAYSRVEDIFRRGIRGLEFTYVTNQPRVLPSGTDMTYFRINRDASKEEWAHLQNTLQMAIRLNENLLAEGIDGRSELTLRLDGGKPAKMTFTLYVVPPETADLD
jgi:type VI secretion system protein ImpJ